MKQWHRAGRVLERWGRSATDETGGRYGAIGLGGCRIVWDGADHSDDDGGRDATVLLHPERGAAMALQLRHLDGLADDSFEVYVAHANGSRVYVGHYGDYYSTEERVVSFFDLSAIGFGRGRDFRVKLKATGNAWSGWAGWGQVCFGWIKVYGNGAPRQVQHRCWLASRLPELSLGAASCASGTDRKGRKSPLRVDRAER